MKTNVYIDGFNLYFGAVSRTPYKWLNVAEVCRKLLTQNQINSIKYFTARVVARPHDPQQPMRQQVYFRALQTIPNLTIIYGTFLSHEVDMPLANSSTSPPPMVRVIKTEEKGSDVNLAAYLLKDGYENDYECAVVVSNDSDLVEPIKIIRQNLGKPVGVLSPYTRPSRELRQQATFIKPIRTGVLQSSQFPPVMQDATGTFHKPNTW
ncbi:MAG: NYN domain-containing protein [Candidatus Latescibacteria bacterium]|nr:NYN domain-containing protein [Candidatus Latescibacterota bacterium]